MAGAADPPAELPFVLTPCRRGLEWKLAWLSDRLPFMLSETKEPFPNPRSFI